MDRLHVYLSDDDYIRRPYNDESCYSLAVTQITADRYSNVILHQSQRYEFVQPPTTPTLVYQHERLTRREQLVSGSGTSLLLGAAKKSKRSEVASAQSLAGLRHTMTRPFDRLSLMTKLLYGG